MESRCVYNNVGNYVDIIDELTHVTPVVNLWSILDTGMLYNNLDRKKYGIVAQSGFGDSDVEVDNLCEGCTNFYKYPELKNKCGDAIGITFGVLAYGNKIVDRYNSGIYSQSDCCLFFSNQLLENKYYHINTDDNLGFYIYNGITHHEYLNPPKYLLSFDDSNIHNMTPEIYFESQFVELLIRESVNLKYLYHIEFSNMSTMLIYKDCLKQMNISCSINKSIAEAT